MYALIGYQGQDKTFSANAETVEEALYCTEGYLKRHEGRVEIYRNGELWLTLDRDAFTA